MCGVDIGWAKFSVCHAVKVKDSIRIEKWLCERIADQEDSMVDKFHKMIDFFDSLPPCDYYVIENQYPFANKDMIALQYALAGHLEQKLGRAKVRVLCQSVVKRHFKLTTGNWAGNKKAALAFVRECGFTHLSDHNMADSYLLAKYFLEVAI